MMMAVAPERRESTHGLEVSEWVSIEVSARRRVAWRRRVERHVVRPYC